MATFPEATLLGKTSFKIYIKRILKLVQMKLTMFGNFSFATSNVFPYIVDIALILSSHGQIE